MLVRLKQTGEVCECRWNGVVWVLRDIVTGEIYTTRNEFMRSNFEITG